MPDRSVRNIRIRIEYLGARYCGWQRQDGFRRKPSIQGQIEQALRKILRERIALTGAGRTDAGVHALGQVANFRTKSKIPAEKIRYALNALLPADIAVSAAEDTRLKFHSRFFSKSKRYRYTILNRRSRSVFLKDRAYFYPYPLDLDAMRRACRYLSGRHDFAAFCASGSKVKDTVRTIKTIEIREIIQEPRTTNHDPRTTHKDSLIIIDITADGFLYNMARSIVGTLIEVGRGKLKPADLKRIMFSRDRSLVGQTAPAHGLCLVEVKL